MLDFTSSLYLGFRHPTKTLRSWPSLTMGIPAALKPVTGAGPVARELAALMGCESGTLGPSTFHLFWDLFGMLAEDGVALYLDSGAYPIVRWGVERAAARGIPVRHFRHYDPEGPGRLLKHVRHRHLRPIVVTDGLCPFSGKPAPLKAYLKAARAHGGLLILDDSQALGILGYEAGSGIPYGWGGGGTLRYSGVSGPDIVVVSSLAKGFGVPMAVLAGSKKMVRNFEERSETRVHCSPPSLVDIQAARHAMALNRQHGDSLRQHLAQLVHYFRRRLTQAGIFVEGGKFPVQTLVPEYDAPKLYESLRRRGIKTVLRSERHRQEGERPRLSFILNARHQFSHLCHASDCLISLLQNSSNLLAKMSIYRLNRDGNKPQVWLSRQLQ
jgi:8-amino-7-oxononanoate synthase